MNLKRPKRAAFELRHEVVLKPGLTKVGVPLALSGGAIMAVGFAFFFVCNLPGRTGNLVFLLALGLPVLLLGLWGCRSAMERETVWIKGSPLQVYVCRFRAPQRIAFDAPGVKVLQQRLYSAADIEWVSVHLGTTSDDGGTAFDTRGPSPHYWYAILKPNDLPPKKLGTFMTSHHANDASFKDALEEAGALGQEVARALQVPFLWDECPALKQDPSYAAWLHRQFSQQGWLWPWAVPTPAPARAFWKRWASTRAGA